jgi:hypothetical protein
MEQDGGMTIDFLPHPHDVAERCMFGRHSPRCEGERVPLLQVVVTGRCPVAGAGAWLPCDERRELLGPFDGDVLHRHPGQIGA